MSSQVVHGCRIFYYKDGHPDIVVVLPDSTPRKPMMQSSISLETNQLVAYLYLLGDDSPGKRR